MKMIIRLTPKSIIAYSDLDVYNLTPEINWEINHADCDVFRRNADGDRISVALEQISMYPDITWSNIYEVVTLIKLLKPFNQIDWQSTFDILPIPKRVSLARMIEELEFFEEFGDPERNYNAHRMEFDPLVEFLEEHELWFHEIDEERKRVIFKGLPPFFTNDVPCRGEFREHLLLKTLTNRWSILLNLS